MIGLPFMVRTILGLNAKFYGATESMLGLTGILGSIMAGLIAGKFKIKKLYWTLSTIGVCLLPVGAVFIISTDTYLRYAVLMLCFALIQLAACIFSVFALSVIQQLTPVHMTGKVMAYIATFSLCAQPLGQIIYGLLFDHFADSVYMIILPTGFILCLTGYSSKVFFAKVGQQLEAD